MKTAIVATTALAFATLLGAPALAEPSVEGLWEQADSNGNVNAWFLFEKKDGAYVGRIAKGFPKPGQASIDTCAKCPGERKGAHMLGLTIVYGMKRDGLHYDEGKILDPRDGSMYHAMMDLSDDGQNLSVRGYVMLKALGQTQVWRRLPDDAMKPGDIPKETFADADVASPDDSKADSKAAKAPGHNSKPAHYAANASSADPAAQTR